MCDGCVGIGECMWFACRHAGECGVCWCMFYMLIFVLGPSIFLNVCVRECMVLNVCESTCESVLSGANMLMNVGVREWVWLSARESACESACVGANTRCECWCS